MLVYAFIALRAPPISASMSQPATAIGSRPTAVSTEKRPPTSSGTTKVSKPSLSASCFKVPRALSVVQKIRSLAPSLPYFFSRSSLKTLKAMAGSVVVPDFEIMLMDTSLPSQIVTSSCRAVELIEFPVK